MKFKIAIIGYGFVGKAIEYAFRSPSTEIMVIDPKYKEFTNEIDDIAEFAPNLTFVSVPTPMAKDGSIDSSIVESVVKKLQTIPSGIVVIKSTITPNIVAKICRYKRFIYNPEFLTERNPFEEFVNPKFHIFGGDIEYCKKLRDAYHQYSICNPCKIFYMTHEEASLVKYGINSFLATKVLWFNQFRDVVEMTNSRYNVVVNAITSDDRIGPSHTKVPGFDGKKGFGGSCFPKDTAAFATYSNGLMSVLDEVIEANNQYREVYNQDSREREQNITYVSTKKA